MRQNAVEELDDEEAEGDELDEARRKGNPRDENCDIRSACDIGIRYPLLQVASHRGSLRMRLKVFSPHMSTSVHIAYIVNLDFCRRLDRVVEVCTGSMFCF